MSIGVGISARAANRPEVSAETRCARTNPAQTVPEQSREVPDPAIDVLCGVMAPTFLSARE